MKSEHLSDGQTRRVIVILSAAIVLLSILICFSGSKMTSITAAETRGIKKSSTDSAIDAKSSLVSEASSKTASRAVGNNQLVSASSKLTAARDLAAKANHLPIEDSFIIGHGLDSRSSTEFVNAVDFSNKMSLFESQMLKDPLAIELRNEYQSQIRDEIEQLRINMELTKLVCGLKICAGAYRTTTPANFNVWDAHQLDPASSRSPMYAIVQSQVYVHGNESEQRFVFTVSKENSSIVTNLYWKQE